MTSKYERLLALRHAHPRGGLRASVAALRSLATAFPGALRQLDTVATETLHARLTWLRTHDARTELPAWVGFEQGYHAWMRVALGVRASDETDDASLAELLTLREGVLVDADFVVRSRRPEDGRLRTVVLERLARDHGVSVAHVRAVLFPPRDRPAPTP